MPRPIYILFSLLLLANSTGCQMGHHTPDKPQCPVVILYDNDVHCAVEGYAAMAALQDEMSASTPYVATVSCGDFAQGDIVGTLTEGEAIIEIMNKVGYDFVALGNHEFDFGMEQHINLTRKLNAEVLCANLTNIPENKSVYKPYGTIKYGNTDIAFIGIATPATATSVSPKTFHDSTGNTIYSFQPHTLFGQVQQIVDQVRRKGADYVVVLSHLGDSKEEDFPTSLELIANTTGIDAVLDGHSHSTIPCNRIPNKEGKGVVLSSSGYCFQNIGVLTLSTDGEFSARLVESASVGVDSAVMSLVNSIKQGALEAGSKTIGHSSVTMNALDSNKDWIVREKETPIGNFCADAFRVVLDTDIAMINGGGIRADLKAGEISYNTLLSVFPFNNTACKAAITGQQLLDALEVSVMTLPQRAGSFMQVSGIKFKVDASVASPVVKDSQGLFSHIGEGKRRVRDVEILDKKSGKWLPVELSRTYTLGGINYNITQMGSDGIFRYTTLLQDNLGQDIDILAEYLELLGGVIGQDYGKAQERITIKP